MFAYFDGEWYETPNKIIFVDIEKDTIHCEYNFAGNISIDISKDGLVAAAGFVGMKGNYLYMLNPKWLTSVEDERESERLFVSPNPARDYIELRHPSLPLPANEERIRVEVFDVLGRRHTPSFGHPSPRNNRDLRQEGNIRINISYLQPGIYFVRVGDEMIKFIKI